MERREKKMRAGRLRRGFAFRRCCCCCCCFSPPRLGDGPHPRTHTLHAPPSLSSYHPSTIATQPAAADAQTPGDFTSVGQTCAVMCSTPATATTPSFPRGDPSLCLGQAAAPQKKAPARRCVSPAPARRPPSRSLSLFPAPADRRAQRLPVQEARVHLEHALPRHLPAVLLHHPRRRADVVAALPVV